MPITIRYVEIITSKIISQYTGDKTDNSNAIEHGLLILDVIIYTYLIGS